jgi:hypothetical protein
MNERQQRNMCLTFQNALLMLATPKGIKAAEYAATDSDESEKLLNVTTMLSACLQGERAYRCADYPDGLPTLLWHSSLIRAIRFADDLRTAMQADAECAPQVDGLRCETKPTNLPTRIYLVLLIADRELRAEVAKLETVDPTLASFHAAQWTAYQMIADGAFAPKELA